ncbi:translation elongation factor-like protein [Candidatus Woesearchaeota archaeon]|nr:translation elongation factor-like protein [Candidatus Woesearchaeota archaeon]
MAEKDVIGEVTHYFPKISVGIIKLHKDLCVGELIGFGAKESANEHFTQQVHSIQMEHTAVQHAKAGQEIGMKVDKPVHAGEMVCRA